MSSLSGETRLAGVIGWPVRHSQSPAIHNAAYAAADLDWAYLAFPVPPGRAGDAVVAMDALGLEGLSVTMPHKHAVVAAVDRVTDDAAALGAANTVFRDGDALVGDNTDGGGFVDSLLEGGVDPAGRNCVVVGGGGAARAVVRALHVAGADRVVVVNRTRARAESAAALAGESGRGVGMDGIEDALQVADLAVNTTPLGMGEDESLAFPVSSLPSSAVVADLVYHPRQTPLLRAAAERELHTVGGIGMVSHQAARQFERFTGLDAPIAAMAAAVR